MMAKDKFTCKECGGDCFKWKSQVKGETFCNKSCARSFKNKVDNPSLHRDLSGKNNPMYGRHPNAWNKGLKGNKSHNWKGGIHKRNDGYFRININGERILLHRFLLKDKLKAHNVVHHKDLNPSNNNLDNLVVLENQAEHVKLHHAL